MAKASGSKQHKATKTAQAHQDMRVFFDGTRTPMHLGEVELSFAVRSGRMLRPLDGLVQAADWQHTFDNPILSGHITTSIPVSDHMKLLHVKGGTSLPSALQDGDVVMCEWRPGTTERREVGKFVPWSKYDALTTVADPSVDEIDLSKRGVTIWRKQRVMAGWRPLWTMRVWRPDLDLMADSGTYDLYDDLYYLQHTGGTLPHYKKDKHHPHGWYAHEIAIDLARKYKFAIGTLPECKHRITNLGTSTHASPYDAIKRAFKIEANYSGHRYMMAWRNGALCVEPAFRRSEPYILGGLSTSFEYVREKRKDFCTVLTVRGTVKHGKTHKKISRTIVNQRAVDQFGAIHRSEHVPHASSVHELETIGKQILARNSIRQRKVSFEHGLVPGVRLGQAIKVDVSHGPDNDTCWVSSLSCNASPGSLTMSIEAQFDPITSRNDIIVADAKTKSKKSSSRSARKSSARKSSSSSG